MFQEQLDSFKTTPPYKHYTLLIQTEKEAMFAYRDTARAIGKRPIFILEGLGIEWEEIRRIASDFKNRGCCRSGTSQNGKNSRVGEF